MLLYWAYKKRLVHWCRHV